MFLHLPIARSKAVRTLFTATVIVTAGLTVWLSLLQNSPNTRGLTPIFFVLFEYFDFRAAPWMLAILLAAIFVPGSPSTRSVLKWLGENSALTALISTLVMCAGALLAYRAHPLSMDEYAPLFQSQAFAAGHLAGHLPLTLMDWLIPTGFQNYFLNVSRVSGDVASSYWPGFALLLTPFTWLGIPWACNPVLSGLTVLVIHRLALKLFGSVESAGLGRSDLDEAWEIMATAPLFGFAAFVIVLSAGFTWTYPHTGWRRLSIVFAPLSCIGVYAFLTTSEYYYAYANVALPLSLVALVFGAPLLLLAREIALWVRRGFAVGGKSEVPKA